MDEHFDKSAREKNELSTERQNLCGDKILIVCEFGELPIELDELESEKIKFLRNPRDWRCGCGS